MSSIRVRVGEEARKCLGLPGDELPSATKPVRRRKSLIESRGISVWAERQVQSLICSCVVLQRRYEATAEDHVHLLRACACDIGKEPRESVAPRGTVAAESRRSRNELDLRGVD